MSGDVWEIVLVSLVAILAYNATGWVFARLRGSG